MKNLQVVAELFECVKGVDECECVCSTWLPTTDTELLHNRNVHTKVELLMLARVCLKASSRSLSSVGFCQKASQEQQLVARKIGDYTAVYVPLFGTEAQLPPDIRV